MFSSAAVAALARRAAVRSPATLAARTGTRAVTTAAGEELFDKILIANRGEISCRVSRSARKLGIKSVAVYSDPDAAAVHVREADEAICVGPAPSDQSYLNVPRILEAIERTGAQAVHPGYGFLSENSAFAEALAEKGIEFIGPGVEAIEKMGDKIESKIIAKNAKVNTIPGFIGLVENDDDVVRISNEIGYPVMIKASAGGGGKGMRIAWNDEEAKLGFRLSKDEALSSFGDDRIFIEKFIEEPRHIEIQILADKHGNVVALPERECSVQRRNQKVVEESPSVLLDEETRLAMQNQACELARAVNYESAGTVEFLCDKHKNFYFLEMNTRLQVEHPVTEYVTGIDLVEQMLRIAAGYPLPDELLAGPVPIKGWAIEGRVYAEDPYRNFLPSTGSLTQYKEPACGEANPNVRCDSGVREGSAISMFYDPMICKLVTWGPDRKAAIDEINSALDHYVIRGVGHNTPFLRDVCTNERFVEGRLTTGFIEEEYPDGFQGVQLSNTQKQHMIAAAVAMHTVLEEQRSTISGASEAYLDALDEKLATTAQNLIITVDEHGDEPQDFSIQVAPPSYDGSLRLHFNDSGETVVLSSIDWSKNQPLFTANVGEEEEELVVQHMEELPEGFRVTVAGATHEVAVRTPEQRKLAEIMPERLVMDTSNMLVSPMPGTLVSVAVEVGQAVEEGQELAVVEAMKMANVLRSPKKGVIASIPAAEGGTLAVDDIIMTFEVEETD